MAFDYNDWTDELIGYINSDLGFDADEDDITRFIQEQIDNACIYTSDCWEIAQEIGESSGWDTLADGSPITSIEDLAWHSLYSEIFENGDLDDILSEVNKVVGYAIYFRNMRTAFPGLIIFDDEDVAQEKLEELNNLVDDIDDGSIDEVDVEILMDDILSDSENVLEELNKRDAIDKVNGEFVYEVDSHEFYKVVNGDTFIDLYM